MSSVSSGSSRSHLISLQFSPDFSPIAIDVDINKPDFRISYYQAVSAPQVLPHRFFRFFPISSYHFSILSTHQRNCQEKSMCQWIQNYLEALFSSAFFQRRSQFYLEEEALCWIQFLPFLLKQLLFLVLKLLLRKKQFFKGYHGFFQNYYIILTFLDQDHRHLHDRNRNFEMCFSFLRKMKDEKRNKNYTKKTDTDTFFLFTHIFFQFPKIKLLKFEICKNLA